MSVQTEGRLCDGEGNKFSDKLSRLWQTLKQEGFSSAVRRIYRGILIRLHYHFIDKHFEAFYRIPVDGDVPSLNCTSNEFNESQIVSEKLPSEIARQIEKDVAQYQFKYGMATPRTVFSWVLDEIKEDFENFTFVDIGSGRGSVLLAASHYPFAKIIGVEYAPILHAAAVENIAAYPRRLMRCEEVSSLCLDARSYDFPKDNLIIFMYNPFEDDVLQVVLENLMASLEEEPRLVYLAYVNPRFKAGLIDAKYFTELGMGWKKRLKLWLLSPLPFRIYQSCLR